MPYRVGSRGSYGCSGYPAVKEGTNEVMGCHQTRSAAAAQIYAINVSEGNIGKSMHVLNEGDLVMGNTKVGVVHGMIEHIMWEGGTLGTPGSEYALESMPPDNPAMSVRVYDEEDGMWKPTAYSVGMMYMDATRLESLEDHEMPSDDDMDNDTDNDLDMDNDNLQMSKEEKPDYEDMIKPRRGGSDPANPRLYARVVQAAKDKFDVYPSAVANAWVVQEYKRRGGTYKMHGPQKEVKKGNDIWSNTPFDPKSFKK